MCLKLLKKLNSLLIMIGVTLWMLSGIFMLTASAEDTGKISLLCKTTDGIIMEGMHWDIYNIGIRDKNDEYILQGDFEKYPVSLKDKSTSAITDAAKTLENYAIIDRINPLASDDADENGQLSFTGLESGLYLLSGSYVRIGNVYYFPFAFIVEISRNENVLDMTVHPKYIVRVESNQKEKHTVKKVWENDSEQDRSAYITAEIYRDNTLFETVELNESNDWTYEWISSGIYDWRVIEKEVPANYTVVYRSNETQFVMVNTFDTSTDITEPPTDETEPTNPTDPTTESTTEITEPTTESNKTTTTVVTTKKVVVTTTGKEKLPQTGQLWWPVPVLALGGLILIVVGIRLRTKE